ncbi:hypothetical protein P7E14_13850 [Enterococcus gallinarum]|uniref:hypothetical protein n=1 Tax=Enterococcus gallinarum TaxID=1353 RepID=UPI00288DB13D|nr:hypothetical protein [Enterococcus gallinarum]MDT2724917.1 hypothetical protein [Enterococcus gallinarum]
MSLMTDYLQASFKVLPLQSNKKIPLLQQKHSQMVLRALNDMLYEFLGSGRPKLDEINKINAIAAAIQCLATKHAEDMLVLESEEVT